METLSNISSAASKAIWGESGNTSTTNQTGTEPIAGEQGKGTVNDPFDHGNEEERNNTTGSTYTGSRDTTTGLHDSTTGSRDSTTGTYDSTTGSHDTTSNTHNTSAETSGSNTAGSHDSSANTTGSSTIASHTVGSTGANTNQPPSSGVDTSGSTASGPSNAVAGHETGDPKSGQAPKTKQQGAGNPTEEPKEDSFAAKMPHSDEERERLMEKGEFPHDPNDHSGEPLKMHSEKPPGENAEEDKDEEGRTLKKDRSQSVAHEGGAPHGASKGTGQEYVKSSGMAADGGDFDATKPGAGSEANRLLESKGIHKDAGNKGPPITGDDNSTTSATGSAKVSKMDKIKEKLHIGKH